MTNQNCLALNASYEPLVMVPMKRALRLLLQGKADILEGDDTRAVRSEKESIPRPAVIRLRKFVKVPSRFRRKVSNTFLFARDQYTCQYCRRTERELVGREVLNRDHVLPTSRGGENSWTNCVTACSTCNLKKDNKTPDEAGMTLLRQPTEPHLVYLKWQVRSLTDMQAKYITLFYGDEWTRQLARLSRAG